MLTEGNGISTVPGGQLRTSVALRLLGVGLIIVSAAGIVVSLTSSVDRGKASGVLFPVILIAGTTLVDTRFSLLPYVAWDQTQVTVGNPFFMKTIPWSDIEQVIPGQICLGFRLRNGRRVWAWAIQRANAAAPGRSRVDKVAAVLEEQRQASSDVVSSVGATRTVQIPWPELIVLAAYTLILAWHIFG